MSASYFCFGEEDPALKIHPNEFILEQFLLSLSSQHLDVVEHLEVVVEVPSAQEVAESAGAKVVAQARQVQPALDEGVAGLRPRPAVRVALVHRPEQLPTPLVGHPADIEGAPVGSGTARG